MPQIALEICSIWADIRYMIYRNTTFLSAQIICSLPTSGTAYTTYTNDFSRNRRSCKNPLIEDQKTRSTRDTFHLNP